MLFPLKGKHKLIMMLKKYKISHEMIAKWFNYSSIFSFRNSSAKKRIEEAIEQIIKHVENEIRNKI